MCLGIPYSVSRQLFSVFSVYANDTTWITPTFHGTSTLCMVPTSREYSCCELPWKMNYSSTTEPTTHPNTIFFPTLPKKQHVDGVTLLGISGVTSVVALFPGSPVPERGSLGTRCINKASATLVHWRVRYVNVEVVAASLCGLSNITVCSFSSEHSSEVHAGGRPLHL